MYYLNLTLLLLGSSLPLALLTSAGTEPLIKKPWKRHTIDNTSLGADGVRTTDINQDGLPDLVVGWEQGKISRIYLMKREGSPEVPDWIHIDAGPAPSVEDALLVDLDHDGAIDVVSSTEGSHKKVLVHWAPPPTEDYSDSRLWKTETLFENGGRWMFAVAMNIDGRNGIDLVIGGKNPEGSVGWLESPENPRDLSNWKFHLLTSASWVMSIIAKDMNADGQADLLISERKAEQSGIYWLEYPGKSSAILRRPWQKTWIADHLTDTMFIDCWDFDGDGIDEIIVPHKLPDAGFLSIFHTQDRSTWKEIKLLYPPSISNPKSVQAGDINLDGKVDLVLSTEGADQNRSGIVWLEYTDSWDNPAWTVHDVSGPEGIKFDLNLLLDVDADGDLDIINTEENDNAKGGNAGLGLVWYENPILPN